MDRSSLADLHARLAPEGGGGVIDAVGAIDATALAGVANEHGARFVHLAGPSTKRGLLESRASEMAVPGGAGRNWDALEEPHRVDRPGPARRRRRGNLPGDRHDRSRSEIEGR